MKENFKFYQRLQNLVDIISFDSVKWCCLTKVKTKAREIAKALGGGECFKGSNG